MLPARELQGIAELSRYSTRNRSPRAEESACTCGEIQGRCRGDIYGRYRGDIGRGAIYGRYRGDIGGIWEDEEREEGWLRARARTRVRVGVRAGVGAGVRLRVRVRVRWG